MRLRRVVPINLHRGPYGEYPLVLLVPDLDPDIAGIASRQSASSNLSRRAYPCVHSSVQAMELGAFVIAHAVRPIKDVETIEGHSNPLASVDCSQPYSPYSVSELSCIRLTASVGQDKKIIPALFTSAHYGPDLEAPFGKRGRFLFATSDFQKKFVSWPRAFQNRTRSPIVLLKRRTAARSLGA
jgi:hypothetical protein